MSGLEQTFYIMAIVFMSLTFLMFVALLVAVLVIRKKINKIHDTIDAKIHSLTSLAEHGGELSALAGKTVLRHAKKAFKKAKK